MKITFQQVKNYVLTNCSHAIERIIDSTEPFVMDYIECPVGYTETNNLNNINELTKEINEHFKDFTYEEDGRVRRHMINRVIKTEISRWNESHDAWYYGRHIGRLAHLLNNSTPIKQSNTIN